MKKRTTLGYRQLCINASSDEIVKTYTSGNVRMEIVNAHAVRHRFGEVPDADRGAYAIALYMNDAIIDTTFAVDDLSDQTSQSTQLLSTLFSRAIMRTLLRRYVGKGLLATEVQPFQQGLFGILKQVLPVASVVNSTLPQGMHWFTGLITLLCRAIGPMASMNYHLTFPAGSAFVTRALSVENPKHEVQVITKITIVGDPVPSTPEHTLRSQKTEITIRSAQPVAEVSRDKDVIDFCQYTANQLISQENSMVLNAYKKQQSRIKTAIMI